MRSLACACTVLAAVLIAGPVLAAPAAEQPSAEPAVAPAASGAACPNVVALESLSAGELEKWMSAAGVEALSASAGPTDPPLCPKRISCDPCGEGNGPCFLTPFGSDTCCTSPSGPCFQCPEGQTIFVSTCPCFGEFAGGRCPPRDQDWFCA